MKSSLNKRVIIGMGILLSALVYIIWLSIGAITSNKVKPIDSAVVESYRTQIKNEFNSVKEIDVFYRFERINFSVKTNSDMSLEECRSVVKATKEFIDTQGIKKFLPEGMDEEQAISVYFKIDNNDYLFECPYWVTADSSNTNSTASVKNNYKKWVLTVNDEDPVQIVFEP